MRNQENKQYTVGGAILLTVLIPLTAMAGVPDWIDTKDDVAPLWVSVEEAAPNGQLREELLPESSKKSIKRMAENIRAHRAKTGDIGVRTKSGSDCVLWSIVMDDNPTRLENPTLRNLFRDSTQIYIGTITDLAQGFVNGFPGTLLDITVKNALKDSQEGVSRFIYAHFPHAEIQIGREFLCFKSSRYSDLPEIGRSIFVFERSASNEPILHASDVEILFERADGTIALPRGFKEAVYNVAQVQEFLNSFGLEEDK